MILTKPERKIMATACRKMKRYYLAKNPKPLERCPLCVAAWKINHSDPYSNCAFCPWKIFEGMTCVDFARKFADDIEINAATHLRNTRPKKWVAIRIEQIDKWLKGLK